MQVILSPCSLKDGRTLSLRSPVESEAAELLAYLRQLHHESWENLNSRADHFDFFTAVKEAEFIRDFAKKPKGFLISAFDGARVVGNLSLWNLSSNLSPHCGELGLGVLEAFRGLGLGRALIQRAIDEAASLGMWNLRLTVRDFNHGAIWLYEDLGFEQVGAYQAVAKLSDTRFADELIYQRLGPRK